MKRHWIFWLSLMMVTVGAQAGWLQEIVADGQALSKPRVVERDGVTHLVVGGTTEAADRLYYARIEGSSWSLEPVPGPRAAAANPSLALDPAGEPMISCHEPTGKDLYLARRIGGSWNVERVATHGNTGIYSAVAWGPEGSPIIAYSGEQYWNLRLARWVDGAWEHEIVRDAPSGSIGSAVDMAVEPDGTIVIVCSAWPNPTAPELSELRLEPGQTDWRYRQLIRGESDMPRLVQGNGGALHLACTVEGTLYCGLLDGSGWDREAVDGGDAGQTLDLKLAPDGSPRLSYYVPLSWVNGELRYAEKTGGSWTVETLVDEGSAGHHSALYSDAAGEPRIIYLDATHQALMETQRSGGSWTIMDRDPATDRGTEMELTLLGADWAMVYEDSLAEAVYLARESAGAWSEELVAEDAAEPCLVEDDQGRPWVIWRHSRASGLYASYQDTDRSWATITLDEGLDTGRSPSAVWLEGSPGELLVGYVDTLEGALKTVTTDGLTVEVQTLEASGATGMVAAATMPGGSAALAYSHEGGLRYIELPGGTATPPTVDASADALGICLRFDRFDRPCIAYMDELTNSIRYAFREDRAWVVEDLPGDGGHVGIAATSLAHDDAGDAWMVYYHRADRDLYLAVRGALGWETELLLQEGRVGGFAQLGFDLAGEPVLACYDELARDALFLGETDGDEPWTEIRTNQDVFSGGDTFELWCALVNPRLAQEVDQYVLLDVAAEYWFWPSWSQDLDFLCRRLPERARTEELLLTFPWPEGTGAGSGVRFWAAMLEAGSLDLVGEIDSCDIAFR